MWVFSCLLIICTIKFSYFLSYLVALFSFFFAIILVKYIFKYSLLWAAQTRLPFLNPSKTSAEPSPRLPQKRRLIPAKKSRKTSTTSKTSCSSWSCFSKKMSSMTSCFAQNTSKKCWTSSLPLILTISRPWRSLLFHWSTWHLLRTSSMAGRHSKPASNFNPYPFSYPTDGQKPENQLLLSIKIAWGFLIILPLMHRRISVGLITPSFSLSLILA